LLVRKSQFLRENHFLEVNHSVALIWPLSIAPGGHETFAQRVPASVAIDMMLAGASTESRKRSARGRLAEGLRAVPLPALVKQRLRSECDDIHGRVAKGSISRKIHQYGRQRRPDKTAS
jgi:hypothetical protein